MAPGRTGWNVNRWEGNVQPRTHHRGDKQLPSTAISSFRPTLKRFVFKGSYPRKPQGTQNRVAPLTARLLFLLPRLNARLQSRAPSGTSKIFQGSDAGIC